MKSIVDQAQPFDEALLDDLTLEHQLLDRSRNLKARVAAAERRDLVTLCDRPIAALHYKRRPEQHYGS